MTNKADKWMIGAHDCAIFKRKKDRWVWEMGGTLQRYPRIGERTVVAYSSSVFMNTGPINSVISVDETEVNALEAVFQDDTTLWKMIFPAHANDLKTIKKHLEVV